MQTSELASTDYWANRGSPRYLSHGEVPNAMSQDDHFPSTGSLSKTWYVNSKAQTSEMTAAVQCCLG